MPKLIALMQGDAEIAADFAAYAYVGALVAALAKGSEQTAEAPMVQNGAGHGSLN
jgi:hypothetical protein